LTFEIDEAGAASAGALALPDGVRALVLASGKIGHEVNCLGVARALGLQPRVVDLRPRALFAALAPYGPVDPRDGPKRTDGPLTPPYPDIVFASGRISVPYFRALKRLSRGRVFGVFLQDPRWSRSAADLIWVPEHDRLRGERVFVTPTSPHPLGPLALERARRAPDPRVAALPPPRLALVLGGQSSVYRFEPHDCAALAAIVRLAAAAGFSVMATPSRRTPAALVDAVRAAVAEAPRQNFFWDGQGDNPYPSMLATADCVVVTADSVNMVGEALATRAPVHVFEPSGGDAKMRGFIERLTARDALRRWAGRFESWRREPIDATADIAHAVRDRYLRFRAAQRAAAPAETRTEAAG
jgi:uncharacterized protein